MDGKSFCRCIRLRKTLGFVLTCKCGENDETNLDWHWDNNSFLPGSRLLENQTIYLKSPLLRKNICVKGETPMTDNNIYFWEIKILSRDMIWNTVRIFLFLKYFFNKF